MIRRLGAAIVIIAVLVLPLALAGPASAGSGGPPPGVSCGGVGCSVPLERFIHFSGNWSPGTSNPVTIPPPPCLWEPIGNGQTGSQQIVSDYGPVPPTSFGVDKSFKLAQQLLKENPIPAGTWYELPINPAASTAGQAECLKLPLYAWVLPGQPYSTVTASLPDGSLSATVWAMARPLSISAGTPDATLYTRGCGYLGSTATARQMAGTGANQPIDCGVTYLRPGTGFGLTASVGWQTYWAITTGDGDGPLPPDPGMQPLANGHLLPSTAGRQVSVGEIQSLNGG
jgi:hypothetical protein